MPKRFELLHGMDAMSERLLFSCATKQTHISLLSNRQNEMSSSSDEESSEIGIVTTDEGDFDEKDDIDSSSSPSSSKKEEEEEESNNSYSFIVKAPGRLCLFGEHQDYLGFPVIAMPIPLYCQINVNVEFGGSSSSNPSNATTTTTKGNTNDEDDDKADDDDEADDNTANKRQKMLEGRKRIIQLDVPQLQQTKIYDIDDLPPRQDRSSLETGPDFALSSIHEILDEGWVFPKSLHVTCTSTSEIIMQAGCSSSTAFITAFMLVLSKVTGNDSKLTSDPLYLAQLAHRAEVTHFSAPGGTMDHVTIAIGNGCTSDGDTDDNTDDVRDGGGGARGPLRIGPGQWDVQHLPSLPHGSDDDMGVFVLADSGEPKDTMKHLHRCKNDRLHLLQDKLDGNWDNGEKILKQDKENNHDDENQKLLTDDERILLESTLINRRTEIQAAEIWNSITTTKKKKDDGPTSTITSGSSQKIGHKLGQLMNEHHEALRDGLQLSTKRLEDMNVAATNAGAWGYKLVGSGGGGCAVAWVPSTSSSKEEEADGDGKETINIANDVASAMRKAGATNTWIITKPCRGAHILYNSDTK